MDPLLGASAYVANNVLPARRVARSSSGVASTEPVSTVPYSVEAVAPLQDSGGFNCIVQMSAASCQRQVVASLRLAPLVLPLTASALNDIVNGATSDGPLKQVVAGVAAQLGQDDFRGLRLLLQPQSLQFPDARSVALRFLATISFVTAGVATPDFETPELQLDVPDFNPGQPVTASVFRVLAAMEERSAPRARAAAMQARPAGQGSVETQARPARRRSPTDPSEGLEAQRRTAAFAMSPTAATGSRVAPAIIKTASGIAFASIPEALWSTPIGGFSAEFRAPLIHQDDPARCRTRVFADLRHATWADSPPVAAPGGTTGDLRRVYDACFANWRDQATALLHAPLDLPLTPTLSLVGQNPYGVAVPEVTDFEVEAFAVNGPSGLQALAVGIDVMPGCHGIVEDVKHFIGPNAYGLISDEIVVSKVFRHKWNLGGFDRALGIISRVQGQVVRDGEQQTEDVEVYGVLDLLSMDTVSIETDSNTRMDDIFLVGQARLTATSVKLLFDDQTATAEEAGLNTPWDLGWGVKCQLTVQGPLDPNAEVREFQIKATRDGGRHITCPFAFFLDNDSRVSPTYTRVYGIAKCILALGRIETTLG